MNIRMDELLRSITTALDAVESDFLGCSTNHGQRIATLCIAMGRQLGMPESQLTAVASCAMLHDNALTEYILSERPGSAQDFNMVAHCLLGQRNAEALPFEAGIDDYILHHHECADGSGPFGKKEGEYSLGAALIAIADMIDSAQHLQRWAPEELPRLREDIRRRTGSDFTAPAAEAMLAVLDEDMLLSLRDERIHFTVAAAMPQWAVRLQDEGIMRLAGIVARIIDYKSTFTRKHSVQAANMAWHMACRYGYNPEKQAKIYLAAALHDLGKLFVPTDLLEKPGPLTDDEFVTIQSHVWCTGELLSRVSGFEDICAWAANHHEKLDGTGYAAGKAAQQLDFVSRMMACIDIYQAVSDERPYHPARTHEESMDILRQMADGGKLDGAIVADLGDEMARFPVGEVPPPPGALV